MNIYINLSMATKNEIEHYFDCQMMSIANNAPNMGERIVASQRTLGFYLGVCQLRYFKVNEQLLQSWDTIFIK